MWDPEALYPRSAFLQAITPPTGGPQDPPTVCVELAASWVEYINAALWALGEQAAVVVANPAALADWQGRLTALMLALATAVECMEAGTVAVTITAGNAEGTTAVVFPTAFSAIPVVVVSESTGDYIASTDSVTETGFNADLTAPTPVIADSTATISWVARLPT